MTYKILVTGSRDWPMTGKKSLVISCFLHMFSNFTAEPIELWHGECPYGGVDALAAAYGDVRGWLVVPFPPKPSDGRTRPIPRDYARRNKRMVDAGPDLVLAFFLKGATNRGTQMTWDMAKGLNRWEIEA